MIVEKKYIDRVKSTSDYNNSLSFYLNEISKIPLLSREEEESLALKAKDGDKDAQDKIVRSNLKFVVAVAKKYRNQGIPLSDLINEGNIGLMMAIKKFDVSMGFHFISYAVWWIRQAILKAICEKSRMIRLPLNRANELIQIERARKKIEAIIETVPSAEMISEESNIDVKTVKHLMDISKETISLETPVFDTPDSSSLGDFITDKNSETPQSHLEQVMLKNAINSVLNTLSDKEKDIIEIRYGLNGNTALSLKEIGKRYNLTKERIRQIEKKALTRLRHSTRSTKLENYMYA